ncbi:hypothetical protein QWY81_08525 [Polaribacter undariae]|uniref:Uncharacterized protein n=2 Tax=Polaribacter sejongensis TaxID=985043 RepID=A0AAJ1QWB8_9FLAO|nr:hypothetical protein [Polaribacter undariae]MDN3619493.1 hypothetical protein [Polaribacter undariae]UWD32391.1 hypothetical protein NQP51_01685 [Polaribacter undariae]
MKKLLTIITIISASIVSAQNNKDSLNVIYKNYFELLKTKDKLDTVVLKVNNFEELMKSNNQIIKKLSDAELFGLKNQLEQRRKKIINTTEFVFASNASLNAIKQLDATSDYLTQISSLNNPENSDLGFSLSEEIAEILENEIIKGNRKINGVKKSKFLLFIDNIIKSPLTEELTSAIPVVSSIKSVVNLVMGNALKGNDVSIDDVIDLKKSLNVYLVHYEGLAKAQTEFEQNLGNLDIRKEGLVLLLTQYTTERSNTLNPNAISEQDKKLTLTNVINKHYTKGIVQQSVDKIISAKPLDYNNHLTNKNLMYPTYALNQAKFIRDEVESLSKEYISIFSTYQSALKQVLEKSKAIGDKNKIDNKISELEIKLLAVQVAFDDNLNIYNLNSKFKALMEY